MFQNVKSILNSDLKSKFPDCVEDVDLFAADAVDSFADSFGEVLKKTSAYWRSLKFISNLHHYIDELIELKVKNDESCDNYVSVLYCRHCHAHHNILPCADECLTTASR